MILESFARSKQFFSEADFEPPRNKETKF